MSSGALIYSHSITPRLQYMADFLSDYYGLEFSLTCSEEVYRNSEVKCKINYSYHRIVPGEIWIHSHVLLFETKERPVKTECFLLNGVKVFFKAEGEVGFDILAAIFYLITRYEEYLPHKKDEYGRYSHENSLAFRENFLHKPLVNSWLEIFRKLLLEKDPAFANRRKFSFLPTYDIDMAWSYKNKGAWRNFASFFRNFFLGKWKEMNTRIKVLGNKMPDPFDAYEWLDRVHKQYKLDPVYFFLVAERLGRYDRNISIKNPDFVSLIKNIASKYKIGLHPSWASAEFPSVIAKEKLWLEENSAREVHLSRQHYIKFELPETYRRLLATGINQEYSMGYGTVNGFRAGISTSYKWYDLQTETATSMLIHPFCFMDANAYYEQKLTAAEAGNEMRQYLEAIKKVNGNMITIWHNSFLGTDPAFAGWREEYENFLKVAAKTG